MMWQLQRKSVEQLYDSNFAAVKSSRMATHATKGHKKDRGTEDCGDTTRRKSARVSNKIPNEKQKKESIAKDPDRKSPAAVPLTHLYDNKTYKPSTQDVTLQRQHHQHNHNHGNCRHNICQNEDKDDDSDEFFELIRRTVETAIGKSIAELLNRNFRELSSKLECLSAELKHSNSFLAQVKGELNNTIAHYGEENSQHFRYLCMKSEYDKMFYQHQALTSAAQRPTNAETFAETRKTAKYKRSSQRVIDEPKAQRKENNTGTRARVTCANCATKAKSPPHEMKGLRKVSSADISQKLSKAPNVLRQKEKHLCDSNCEQRQEIAGTSQSLKVTSLHDYVKINKEIFLENFETDEEDDIYDSSDVITPHNTPSGSPTNGGNTARDSSTHRGHHGAGDG